MSEHKKAPKLYGVDPDTLPPPTPPMKHFDKYEKDEGWQPKDPEAAKKHKGKGPVLYGT